MNQILDVVLMGGHAAGLEELSHSCQYREQDVCQTIEDLFLCVNI
jgi:hypothetical protein